MERASMAEKFTMRTPARAIYNVTVTGTGIDAMNSKNLAVTISGEISTSFEPTKKKRVQADIVGNP
jgi:hypothetical protein